MQKRLRTSSVKGICCFLVTDTFWNLFECMERQEK